MKKLSIVTVAVLTSFTLSSCATVNPGDPASSGGNSSVSCNSAVVGLAGALVGGLLAGGNDRVKGAAIGAAIGALACLAVNATSTQTKSANQVESEYKTTNGQLPSSPSVVAYNTSISPGQVIRPGSNVTVTSDIEVVAGQNEPVQNVSEEIILLDPSGEEFKRATKSVGESGKSGSGAYQNTFSFQMPESAPQGIYSVKTQVYVNGKEEQQRANRIQLVMNPDPMLVAGIN